METRASYLMVGTFVLLFLLSLVVFVVWLTRAQIDREIATYDILFEGSVTGLAVGGDVRYRGIKIGTVSNLAILPDDPRRVRVTVEIDAATPIREGDQASLQLLGVTGVSYVNVEGGDPASPHIQTGKRPPWPVIPSKPSAFAAIFEGAPDLVNQGVLVAERVGDLLNEENRQHVTRILEDIEQLTGALAGRQDQIGRILDALDRSAGELAGVATAVRETSGRLDGLISEATSTFAIARSTLASADDLVKNDARQLIADVGEAARGLQGVASEAESLLAENREPISAFTEGGLHELAKLTIESRLLVSQLSRLTERLENEGVRFLIGSQESELVLDDGKSKR